MQTLFLFFFLIFFPFNLFAQTFLLYGKIVDTQGTKIVNAHLKSLPDEDGSVSNADGNFRILIESQTAQIKISAVGYTTKLISVDSLRKQNTTYIIVSLAEQVIELKEVTVLALSPQEILQKAVENIENNYHLAPYKAEYFYREAAVEDDSLFYFSESIVNFFRKNNQYEKIFKNKLVVEHGFHAKLPKKSKINFGLINGAYNALKQDIIIRKKTFGLSRYSLELKDILWQDGQEVYVIHAKLKTLDTSQWKLTLFIESKTYAIIEVESVMQGSVLKRGLGYKTEMNKFYSKRSYRLVQGKRILAYSIVEQSEMRTYKGKTAKIDLYTELSFNGGLSLNMEFSENTPYYDRKENMEPYTAVYEKDYWKNKNFIPPNGNLLNKIKGQLQDYIDFNLYK